VGDPPEEVAGARAVQILERLGHRHLDVLRRDVVGRRRRIDLPEPSDHRIAAPPGARQVLALDVELREQVGVHGVANSSQRAPVTTMGPATTLGPMENEQIVEEPAVEEVTSSSGIEEELLIEEISIDGMCGVY